MSKDSYETEMLVMTAVIGGLTLYGLSKIGQTAQTAQQQALQTEQQLQAQANQLQSQAQPILQNAQSITQNPLSALWAWLTGKNTPAPAATTAGTTGTGGTS